MNSEMNEIDPPKFERKSFPLRQYNQSIMRLLKEQVPKIWVRAEISQLSVRGNMAYFTLVEHEEGVEKPVASLPAYAWARDFYNFQEECKRVSPELSLRPDLKVCVELEADFYVPYGKLQARICAVDPVFSLGEMARLKAEILKKLNAEGLLKKQRELELPDIPLSIGLITAPGSAAHRDFSTTLLKSQYAIDIHLKEAMMQGPKTAANISAALKEFESEEIDLICIIRGGGSKTDLVWFDSEELCRAIALCPIPVLTGIGHEIDKSLADEVSAVQGITPTASAEWILERLDRQYDDLIDAYELVANYGRSLIEDQWGNLNQVGKSVAEKTRMQLHFASELIRRNKTALHKLSSRQILEATVQKERLSKDLLRSSNRLSQRAVGELQQKKEILKKLSRNELKRQSEKQWTNTNGFERGVSKIANFYLHDLEIFKNRLSEKIKNSLSQQQEKIKSQTQQVKAYDPKRTLERGYAIVRHKSTGKIVKFDELEANDEMETLFEGGLIRSKVIEKSKKA